MLCLKLCVLEKKCATQSQACLAQASCALRHILFKARIATVLRIKLVIRLKDFIMKSKKVDY